MEHKLFSIVIICFTFFSCKQSDILTENSVNKLSQQVNESKALTATLNADYQKLPAFVQYYKEPSAQVYDFEAQNDFIASSGLPLEAGFYSWSKEHSAADAVGLCRNFIAAYRNHKYINVFKQYSAWVLITRFNMLANISESNVQDVEYLTKNLVDSKYEGYQLLYYCLKFVKQNEANESAKIEYYCKNILDYAGSFEGTEKENKASPELPENYNKPMDPRIKEMVDKYLEQKTKSDEYLSLIKKLS